MTVPDNGQAAATGLRDSVMSNAWMLSGQYRLAYPNVRREAFRAGYLAALAAPSPLPSERAVERPDEPCTWADPTQCAIHGRAASPLPSERAADEDCSCDRGEAAMNLDRDITPGLYQKFNVERTDEASRARHPDCAYFVLDLTHDPHARPALVAYIHSCRYAFPELAADLSALLDRLDAPARLAESKRQADLTREIELRLAPVTEEKP